MSHITEQELESVIPTRRDGITFWAMVTASSVSVILGLVEFVHFCKVF